jgi:hypothetical protein
VSGAGPEDIEEGVGVADHDRVVKDRTGSGWDLLRTRDFGLLFSGQVVSQIGDGMNKVGCCGSCMN